MKLRRRSAIWAATVWLLIGCPESLPVSEKWQPVVLAQEDTSPEELERQERARKTAAAIRVKRMQAVFVSDDERRCRQDADCELTPFHCCGCTGGGQQDAVHREQLPAVLQRRIAYCADEVCPQVMSTHPSCAATTAMCQAGRCVPKLDTSTSLPPAEIPVQPIPEDDRAGDVVH